MPPDVWRSKSFVRAVTEFPSRESLHLPGVDVHLPNSIAGGKHPSVQPQLLKKSKALREPETREPTDWPAMVPEISRSVRLDIAKIVETPARISVPTNYDTALRRLTDLRVQTDGVDLITALSIKTMPEQALGMMALQHGCWLEAISFEEMQWGLDCGISPDKLILNGPLAADALSRFGKRIGMAFVDSIESLYRFPLDLVSLPGVRLRPPFIESRFGVSLASKSAFSRLVTAIRERDIAEIAWHLHRPCDSIGPKRWLAAAKSFIDWAVSLSKLCIVTLTTNQFAQPATSNGLTFRTWIGTSFNPVRIRGQGNGSVEH